MADLAERKMVDIAAPRSGAPLPLPWLDSGLIAYRPSTLELDNLPEPVWIDSDASVALGVPISTTAYQQAASDAFGLKADHQSAFIDVQPMDEPAVYAPDDTVAEAQSAANDELVIGSAPNVGASRLLGHRRALILGACALAFAATEAAIASHFGVNLSDVRQQIAANVKWTVPALAVSEATVGLGIVMMALGAGHRIGNPLTLRRRWDEIKASASSNPLYRAGVAVSGLGALASAAILGVAIAQSGLPTQAVVGPESILLLDAAGTVAARGALLSASTRGTDAANERAEVRNVDIRLATQDDIPRLVALDLRLFRKAYGKNPPTEESVAEMLRQRLKNNPHGMLLAVVNGEVKGFATVFRTDKRIEEFTSWENSTANGTLEGVVKPDGRYLYVANLTMDTNGSGDALDMLVANIFAQAIEYGVDYGYFCSRIPGFEGWANRRAKREDTDVPEGAELDKWALEYAQLRHDVDAAGTRTRPRDSELAFYEGLGLELTVPVPNAFVDSSSLNYQVPVIGRTPALAHQLRGVPAARNALAWLLRRAARHPKLLAKVL